MRYTCLKRLPKKRQFRTALIYFLGITQAIFHLLIVGCSREHNSIQQGSSPESIASESKKRERKQKEIHYQEDALTTQTAKHTSTTEQNRKSEGIYNDKTLNLSNTSSILSKDSKLSDRCQSPSNSNFYMSKGASGHAFILEQDDTSNVSRRLISSLSNTLSSEQDDTSGSLQGLML